MSAIMVIYNSANGMRSLLSNYLPFPLLSCYADQKKTLEINPRHPLIHKLQRRVKNEEQDQTTFDLARVLYEAAALRSGYVLKDSADFTGRIERMLRLSLGVDISAEVYVCVCVRVCLLYVCMCVCVWGKG